MMRQRILIFSFLTALGLMPWPTTAQTRQRTPPDSLTVWGYLRDEITGGLVQGHLHLGHAPGIGGRDFSWDAAVTDSGRYELAVPFGARVTAHAPGYLPQTRQAVISEHRFGSQLSVRLEFLLRSDDGLFAPSLPTCDVTGTVVNESNGEALPATEVWIDANVRGSLSDQDGRFALSSVPAGIQLLHTARLGMAPEIRQLLVRCSEGSPYAPLTVLVTEHAIVLDAIIPG